MTQKNSSKSSESFKIIGKGKVLQYLRGHISHAQKSILIVGPWIDGYFVQEVIDSLPNKKIEVKFIVRIDGLEEIDAKTLSALNLASKNIPNYQAKTLEKLHSKVILIDEETFYLGSTNWFWYSLNKAMEFTIISEPTPEFLLELENYWKMGNKISTDLTKDYNDIKPIYEDIDEYARRALKENPKAFVIGKRQR